MAFVSTPVYLFVLFHVLLSEFWGLFCEVHNTLSNSAAESFVFVLDQVEMEDFDANIEDQKEENKKDAAEEEESELVGDLTAMSNKLSFLKMLTKKSYCWAQQRIEVTNNVVLMHMFLGISFLCVSESTLAPMLLLCYF